MIKFFKELGSRFIGSIDAIGSVTTNVVARAQLWSETELLLAQLNAVSEANVGKAEILANFEKRLSKLDPISDETKKLFEEELTKLRSK